MAGLLALAFSLPLWRLMRFAMGSELYSYVLLLPFVSVYLVWTKKKELPGDSRKVPALTALFTLAGSGVLAGYWFLGRSARHPALEDQLAWLISAFFLFLVAVCCLCLGRKTLRAVAMPLGLLVFMIPAPLALLDRIEAFLQYGSAYATDLMFRATGMTFLRDGLIFHLPGISFHVASECSGIHSSLILFITSLMAGCLFLRTPWKRAVFALAVIPLGLLRNGFRIWTIGELCVHVNPAMIDSWIHHKGGPVFFVLSLGPMFVLLRVLEKSDRKPGKPGAGNSGN